MNSGLLIPSSRAEELVDHKYLLITPNNPLQILLCFNSMMPSDWSVKIHYQSELSIFTQALECIFTYFDNTIERSCSVRV